MLKEAARALTDLAKRRQFTRSPKISVNAPNRHTFWGALNRSAWNYMRSEFRVLAKALVVALLVTVVTKVQVTPVKPLLLV